MICSHGTKERAGTGREKDRFRTEMQPDVRLTPTGPGSLEVLFRIAKPRDPGGNSGGGASIPGRLLTLSMDPMVPWLATATAAAARCSPHPPAPLPGRGEHSYQGNCCVLTLLGVVLPTFTMMGSRSLPLPGYFTSAFMFTAWVLFTNEMPSRLRLL